MKTIITSCFLSCLLLLPFPSSVHSGVKEIKGNSVGKVAKPDGSGGFQLRVRFAVPDLPENAHIDQAFFILDQKFEMPVITDTLWLKLNRDTMEVPVGFRNKGRDPLQLSLVCLDESRQARFPDWIDARQLEERKPIETFLVPGERIQLERKEGRWKNEAIRVPVTDFVRDQSSQKGRSMEFSLGGGAGNEGALRPSDVHLEMQNISARLVIFYTEPLVYPPGFK